MFNPRVKDFLKEKPDITIVGLYWAGYWRLAIGYFLIYMIIFFYISLIYS